LPIWVEGNRADFSRGVRNIGQGGRSRDERPNIYQNRQDAKRCDGASENKCAGKNAGALDHGAAKRRAAEGDPNGAGRLAMRKPIMDDLIICGGKRTFSHPEDDANNY
jgi:hypothetical protein